MRHDWPLFGTVWIAVALVITYFCWWLSFRAKTADKAAWVIPIGVFIGIFGPMPLSVWATVQKSYVWLMVAVTAVIICVGPMYVVMRRQNQEAKARRQAAADAYAAWNKQRADDAELWIRKLGA